jgi:hypothetical protein
MIFALFVLRSDIVPVARGCRRATVLLAGRAVVGVVVVLVLGVGTVAGEEHRDGGGADNAETVFHFFRCLSWRDQPAVIAARRRCGALFACDLSGWDALVCGRFLRAAVCFFGCHAAVRLWIVWQGLTTGRGAGCRRRVCELVRH